MFSAFSATTGGRLTGTRFRLLGLAATDVCDSVHRRWDQRGPVEAERPVIWNEAQLTPAEVAVLGQMQRDVAP